MTSQLPGDRWFEVIGDPNLANSMLGRPIHNAPQLTLTGDSMRRKMRTMKALEEARKQ